MGTDQAAYWMNSVTLLPLMRPLEGYKPLGIMCHSSIGRYWTPMPTPDRTVLNHPRGLLAVPADHLHCQHSSLQKGNDRP
jgi:hypothetical protein